MYRLRRNDVISNEINDVIRFAYNDVMPPLNVRSTHHFRKETSLALATSLATNVAASFKKAYPYG